MLGCYKPAWLRVTALGWSGISRAGINDLSLRVNVSVCVVSSGGGRNGISWAGGMMIHDVSPSPGPPPSHMYSGGAFREAHNTMLGDRLYSGGNV